MVPRFPSQLCCVTSGWNLLLLVVIPAAELLPHGCSIRGPWAVAALRTVTQGHEGLCLGRA